MKEFIVLVSTIMLGLAIAVMVFGFKESAESITTKTEAALGQLNPTASAITMDVTMDD